MKTYYVAYFINQQALAGLDDNTGEAYPTDLVGAYITSREDRILEWIKYKNFGKTLKDKNWLALRKINYTLSL